MTPVTPPIKKANRKPMQNSMAVVNCSCPRHMVPIQLKNLMPVGTAMSRLSREKKGSSTDAGGEHVVGPHPGGEGGDGHGGEDHALVAEDRLAGEDREDLGHDAEVGQGQDVHLGMAEEPEEVLPQQRRAAGMAVSAPLTRWQPTTV